MSPIRETINSMTDLAELALKAMILIVLIVLVAKILLQILVDEKIATFGSYIIGIAILFAVVVSRKVREEIMNFGKKRTN